MVRESTRKTRAYLVEKRFARLAFTTRRLSVSDIPSAIFGTWQNSPFLRNYQNRADRCRRLIMRTQYLCIGDDRHHWPSCSSDWITEERRGRLVLPHRSGGATFVAMMQTTNFRNGDDSPSFRWLNRAPLRGVLLQAQMGTTPMIVVAEILRVES